MRAGRPSFTAAAVAAARAIGGVDPLAPALIGGPLAAVVRVASLARAPAAAVNLVTFGLVDHVEMRTRAIDAALHAGVGAGLRQLVVLGAGLDARAWRLPWLAEVRAFEVDHPSTQAFKRARVAERPAAAQEVRFVAVDFTRDLLADALGAAGHEAGAPTFWIWEGVTQYLPRPAVQATLASVGARSAEGSRIAVTYGTPRGTRLGPVAMGAASVGFRALGEQLLGLLLPEAMRAELEAVGFRLLCDASAVQWGERHGEGRRRLLLVDEHLALAVRDAPPCGRIP